MTNTLLSEKFHIDINNLVYNREKNKFISSSEIPNINYYLSNFLTDSIDYKFTRVFKNPVLIIDSLDECYSHALIDRVFPYFWTLQDISDIKDLIIFIKEDKLLKFPVRKQVINREKKAYSNSWNDLINLLNPTEVIFEHLLAKDDIFLFKKSYAYAENYKELKWQRTFWNCTQNYPGRSVQTVIYEDDVIKSYLNLFIKMVKNKYSIVEKINKKKNIIIIDRESNRKFDSTLLSNLDLFFKKCNNLHYNGIHYLEKKSFANQIELFNTNDIIIFRHGSCLANILWVKANTQIIELDHVQYRAAVIKRICNFTNSNHVRYSYKSVLNDNKIIFNPFHI
jgi:hypothetical protein